MTAAINDSTRLPRTRAPRKGARVVLTDTADRWYGRVGTIARYSRKLGTYFIELDTTDEATGKPKSGPHPGRPLERRDGSFLRTAEVQEAEWAALERAALHADALEADAEWEWKRERRERNQARRAADEMADAALAAAEVTVTPDQWISVEERRWGAVVAQEGPERRDSRDRLYHDRIKVEARAERETVMPDLPPRGTVNWSAIGSVSTTVARAYARLILRAAAEADRAAAELAAGPFAAPRREG